MLIDSSASSYTHVGALCRRLLTKSAFGFQVFLYNLDTNLRTLLISQVSVEDIPNDNWVAD